MYFALRIVGKNKPRPPPSPYVVSLLFAVSTRRLIDRPSALTSVYTSSACLVSILVRLVGAMDKSPDCGCRRGRARVWRSLAQHHSWRRESRYRRHVRTLHPHVYHARSTNRIIYPWQREIVDARRPEELELPALRQPVKRKRSARAHASERRGVDTDPQMVIKSQSDSKTLVKKHVYRLNINLRQL